MHPVLAGVVSSVVGFASTFAVVLAGLRAVGADRHQAASGLLALCLAMGVCSVALGLRTQIPVAIAWSTPGAALLASTGAVAGGWPAAVGAFLVSGALLTAAALWRPLGRLIAAIPAALASAMLAGVVLPLCIAPVRAVIALPDLAAPVVVAWALLYRFARRWAVPGALGVAAVVILASQHVRLGPASGLVPELAFTTPHLSGAALVSIALPLFVVTMASQNIPGSAVLRTFGYDPDLRPLLTTTGAASVAASPFGGFAVNLAAITAVLVAGPEAEPDPARRWIASVSGGAVYFVLGLGAAFATAFVAAAPPLLIEAVAGLALLGALGGALSAAMADPETREAATITFAVTASGVSALGIGGAFWGLLAGLALLLVLRRRGGAAA
ncbi:MAG: benzoate/H(+) symporter BenE family transporter [Solirubrobacteraceae bacterium]